MPLQLGGLHPQAAATPLAPPQARPGSFVPRQVGARSKGAGAVLREEPGLLQKRLENRYASKPAPPQRAPRRQRGLRGGLGWGREAGDPRCSSPAPCLLAARAGAGGRAGCAPAPLPPAAGGRGGVVDHVTLQVRRRRPALEDAGAGRSHRLGVHRSNLSCQPRKPSPTAVPVRRAAMGRGIRGALPPGPPPLYLLLLHLLLPLPAARTYSPRISLPLGECGDLREPGGPRGAACDGGRDKG